MQISNTTSYNAQNSERATQNKEQPNSVATNNPKESQNTDLSRYNPAQITISKDAQEALERLKESSPEQSNITTELKSVAAAAYEGIFYGGVSLQKLAQDFVRGSDNQGYFAYLKAKFADNDAFIARLNSYEAMARLANSPLA